MEFLEALETYLVETGQITALAKRQARLLCRSVANTDETIKTEARILLLLNLAALNRGAPRAPVAFLLRPLEKKTVETYASAYKTEHDGVAPEWEEEMADPAARGKASKIIDDCVQSPGRLAPLLGKGPGEIDGQWPLLVVGTIRKSACTGFSRYWRAASVLEEKISRRLNPADKKELPDEKTAKEALVSVFVIDSILESGRLFHYRQVAAAALALREKFLIISGGPGTGKTWVVLQILRTLVRVFKEMAPDRIALCAPTGRAKARLGECIDSGIEILKKKADAGEITESPVDQGLKNLERKTIHGLLGMRPDGSMKYNAQNRLPCRVIVVDEASMVDLNLFAALLDAAAEDCRILLVGDMHQLPSVEAGAVLGDLTGRFDGEGGPTLTKETADWLGKTMEGVKVSEAPEDGESTLVLPNAILVKKAGRLADHAVILTNSYRSTKDILIVSAQVNRGDYENTVKAIEESKGANVVVLDTRGGQKPIAEWLEEHYTKDIIDQVTALKDVDLDAAGDPDHRDYEKGRGRLKKILDVFEGSRILTLTNAGPRGRTAINKLAEQKLKLKLSDRGRGLFFHGQQVVLSYNLHDIDLFNGDTGLVVQSGTGALKVVFRRGETCSVHALERLSGIEPAFAMTVHKAQGSEFKAVMLVLPESESPLLTRQILYTGITRAKESVRILGTKAMLRMAIDTKEDRAGGIELM